MEGAAISQMEERCGMPRLEVPCKMFWLSSSILYMKKTEVQRREEISQVEEPRQENGTLETQNPKIKVPIHLLGMDRPP